MDADRTTHVRTDMSPLVIGGLGTTELLIILAVLVLLFGATKLPELARGSGRALRIFKAETKGLMDDEDSTDDSAMKTPEQLEIDKRHAAEQRAAELEAEAERLRRGETA